MERSWLARFWSEGWVHPIGAGLKNMGKTCFLNAVLQCLTHTVPLVEKLRASDHYSTCSAGDDEFCALCALRQHIEHCLSLSGYVFVPRNFVYNLNKISSYLELGEEEDAYEFLQCLLNRVHSCCINPGSGNQPLPVGDNADSLIKQIFGGRARSRLRCCDCGHISDTFEALLDLSLGINGVDSLTEALELYTKAEMLEPSNCDGCHAIAPKEKQLKLDKAPQVALFHLKRFNIDIDGALAYKIQDFIEFPLQLDLRPFLSSPQDEEQLNYELYAVVVHAGWLDGGHYCSLIRSSQSTWYLMDDANVASCTTMQVLNVQAYMLFYIKQGTSPWFPSLIERQMSCQTSGAPDLRDGNFNIGESSSSGSSKDSVERREDQSSCTDDTPESAIDEVESDSSSTPLRLCDQSGFSHGAGKMAPLDEVRTQSTRRPESKQHITGIEDDKEDHRSPKGHVRSKDGESTSSEATKEGAGNEMLRSMPSPHRSSFQSSLTPCQSYNPRPLRLRNPIPMKRQRKAIWDLNNTTPLRSETPEEQSTCGQSLSRCFIQCDLSRDNSQANPHLHPSDTDQTP